MRRQYQCTISRRSFDARLKTRAIVCRATAGLLMIGSCVFVQGCGNPKGLKPLRGRVTLADGLPLVGARLIFRSNENSENFSATTDKNGDYAAGSTSGTKGIAPGSYTVTMVEYRDPDHPKPPKINSKYTQVKSSGLHVTVPAESNTFNVKLDPPAEAKEQN